MSEMEYEPPQQTLEEMYAQATPTTAQIQEGTTVEVGVIATYAPSVVHDAVRVYRDEQRGVARNMVAGVRQLRALKGEELAQTDLVERVQIERTVPATDEQATIGNRLHSYGRFAVNAIQGVRNMFRPQVNGNRADRVERTINQLTWRRRLALAASWGLGSAALMSGILIATDGSTPSPSPALVAHGIAIDHYHFGVSGSHGEQSKAVSQPAYTSPTTIGEVGGSLGVGLSGLSWGVLAGWKRGKAHQIARRRMGIPPPANG